MIWIDIETTGLSLDTDAILEVGSIITDEFGNPLHKNTWLINNPADRTFIQNGVFGNANDRFDQYVVDMHTKSGLWADWTRAWEDVGDGHTISEFEISFLNWIARLLPEVKKPPMCGSSVHFDRYMLLANAPKVGEYFGYRTIDVSTIREVAKLVNPRIAEHEPTERDTHRVLEDIEDSIELYKFYLDEFLMVGEADIV